MRYFLALLLLVCLVSGVAQTKKPTNSKVSTLKNDLSSLRRKKAAVNRALVETKRKARVVKGDLREVDQRLVDVENRLDKTKTSLAANRKEQAQLAVDLKAATENLAKKRIQVKNRLRELYIRGERSAVGMLVGAQSVGDVASKKFLIERIAEHDRALFEQVDSLQKRVAFQKSRQDKVVQQVYGLVRDQQVQQGELKETHADKAALLGQLQSKQQELERIARQFDREEAAFEARIAAYQRGPGRTNGLVRPTGRLLRPVNGRIGSGFGMRFHPILRRNRMHKGLDMSASSGTPISCAATGIVIAATYMSGFGNCLIVDHGGGLSTLYAHCSRLLVGEGARVSRGQKIALVGSTGLSTGPHLHFEVHVNGKAVNPASWL